MSECVCVCVCVCVCICVCMCVHVYVYVYVCVCMCVCVYVCVFVSQIQLFNRSTDFYETWCDRYIAGANSSAVFHSLTLGNNDVAYVRD